MSTLLKYILAIALSLPCVSWSKMLDQTNPAVLESKNLIFISGQRTGLMNVPDQDGKSLREAFDRIRDIAKKNNASMDDVVQMTIYLADPENDYPRLRGIVSKYFTNASEIARSVVGVSRIPDNDGANFSIHRRVEIDAVIAVKTKMK